MNDPHKERSLGKCDEFHWGVFSYKDSTISVQVILSQKSVKSHVENHVNDEYCKCCFEICLIVYLWAIVPNPSWAIVACYFHFQNC